MTDIVVSYGVSFFFDFVRVAFRVCHLAGWPESGGDAHPGEDMGLQQIPHDYKYSEGYESFHDMVTFLDPFRMGA